jgi:subtilase family serine protease
MSWGTQEFIGELASDSHFNHPGTSFVAAAGDTAGVVDWPAASPYVLAVGGTSLQINSLSGSIT